jgi:hypothetical protein
LTNNPVADSVLVFRVRGGRNQKYISKCNVPFGTQIWGPRFEDPGNGEIQGKCVVGLEEGTHCRYSENEWRWLGVLFDKRLLQ